MSKRASVGAGPAPGAAARLNAQPGPLSAAAVLQQGGPCRPGPWSGLLGEAQAPIAPSTAGPSQALSAPTGEKLRARGKGQAAMNCRGVNSWMSRSGASPAPSRGARGLLVLAATGPGPTGPRSLRAGAGQDSW